jgi:hypothetical protein
MTDQATPASRGFAGDCMIETAEGPVPIAETPGKGFAVLTRLPSGALGFRQLIKVTTTPSVELVRVVLDRGHAVVVARGHGFYRRGMERVAAGDLAPGDVLETAFHYPPGYVPPDAQRPVEQPAITVRAVEPAGTGDVFAGVIRDTHVLFLTAGVLCAE